MLEVGAQPWRSGSFAGGLAVRGLALADGRSLAEDLEVGAVSMRLALKVVCWLRPKILMLKAVC